ncbi:MAG: hypothetical protein GC168_12770 [Candidatus Hydrogenedens sp.]|nr:hypothetical protein [Candidatus Hydrogenedens sp.]
MESPHRHTALIISPHADDAAAFMGGTAARFAAEGWKVVLVRVTDDRKDSVGLTVEETIAANTRELHKAAALLGIAEVVELGFETDQLADVRETALRERFVYLFRKYRPYAVFSFDPFGLYEGNMDHIATAQAVEEAFWVACFDLHHPEHLAEGLAPFSVCERWYFGRHLPGANHAVDVTDYLDQSAAALCAHRTMMRNVIQQYRLQAQTWGKTIPLLEHAFHDDPEPLFREYLHGRGEAVAHQFGLPEGRLAEVFRLVRFGDLEPLFQATGEPIPGAPEPPRREGIDA